MAAFDSQDTTALIYEGGSLGRPDSAVLLDAEGECALVVFRTDCFLPGGDWRPEVVAALAAIVDAYGPVTPALRQGN